MRMGRGDRHGCRKTKPRRQSARLPPVDQYDCVIIDECHRGYFLDRDLSDRELEFRDFDDYISKYRRILDHFDAVKIGLTATPALHTTQIFGLPIFQYSYRDAVIDGVLIDHEPPIRIVTALAEDGIHWKVAEPVAVWGSSLAALMSTRFGYLPFATRRRRPAGASVISSLADTSGNTFAATDTVNSPWGP